MNTEGNINSDQGKQKKMSWKKYQLNYLEGWMGKFLMSQKTY